MIAFGIAIKIVDIPPLRKHGLIISFQNLKRMKNEMYAILRSLKILDGGQL